MTNSRWPNKYDQKWLNMTKIMTTMNIILWVWPKIIFLLYKKSKQPTLSESLCKGLCYYRLVQGFRVAGLFAGQYCLICIKYWRLWHIYRCCMCNYANPRVGSRQSTILCIWTKISPILGLLLLFSVCLGNLWVKISQ